MALLNELKRRDEQAANSKAAADLLEETKAQNGRILAQNNEHHNDVLAQNERHHGETVEQFMRANGVMHRSHTLAVRALIISTVAVIVASVLPVYLEHRLKESQQDANRRHPIQVGSPQAEPKTSKSVEMASPESAATTKLKTTD